MSESRATDGTSFLGALVEVVGPLAVWQTGPTSAKYMPPRALSPEDCVRFVHASGMFGSLPGDSEPARQGAQTPTEAICS